MALSQSLSVAANGLTLVHLQADGIELTQAQLTFVVTALPPTVCGTLFQSTASSSGEPSRGQALVAANTVVSDAQARVWLHAAPATDFQVCSFAFNVSKQTTGRTNLAPGVVSVAVQALVVAPACAPSTPLSAYLGVDLTVQLTAATNISAQAITFYINTVPAHGLLYQYNISADLSSAVSARGAPITQA